MSENFDSALTYTSYLAVDDLLKLQKPLSEGPEHDELLFIIIHQTYELWFKQLIHEFAEAQRALEANETHKALGVLGRIRTIMKTCVSQVDILETMTPLQFLSFRNYLAASSGFQSAQFRKVEAILGRRDEKFASHLPPEIPNSIINRNFRDHYTPNAQVQAALVKVHREDLEAAMVCEKLVDIDEGLQEWRYRHVKMVERTIGSKSGTGGSSGVKYLASTLFNPVFPDLWEIRASL
jgi:tryptophan 2,3-dioxygenase